MSARVGIIYGSASDHDKMVKAAAILERFGVGFEIEAMSAHRSPDRVHEYATTASSVSTRPARRPGTGEPPGASRRRVDEARVLSGNVLQRRRTLTGDPV